MSEKGIRGRREGERMAGQWYIVRGGQRFGPYTLEHLRQFAGSGHLLPVDLVQQEGKEQAIVASQIPGLFPVQSASAPPPPPPPRQADRGQPQAVTSSPPSTAAAPSGQGLADLWAKLLTNKLWFFSALLLLSCVGNTCLVSVFLPSGSSRTRGEPGGTGMMLVSFFGLISLGLLITVIVLGVRQWSAKVDREVRRDKLHGLWEPVNGQGLTFQFTDDGGMIRSDGLATKYRWVSDDQEVELYEEGVEETIRFKIITISRDELVLKTGDQAGHFRKGTTISEEEMQRRWEAAKATLKSVGKGAAVVAGGAAAVLALGGLAVLCGATAASTTGTAGGGDASGRNFREVRCDHCNGTGRTGGAHPEVCIGCGGHGVKRLRV